jgi:hypothetical protein
MVGTGMSNEGKVCDAIVRLLKARTGEARANISHPEKDRTGPPVDLRLRLGTRSYAIEHSKIEAFAGQTHTEAQFSQLVRRVIDELSGVLPKPGVYHLYFPTDAYVGARANELQRIQIGLTEWVREHAQRLHARNPEQATRERNPHGIDDQFRARPPGFPNEVTLRREAHWSLSARHDGVLLAGRFAPEELELRRATRLQEALDRKCPKLQRCKEAGARAVLILEDGDISLSNHILIGDALAGLLEKRPDLPDEIYLVETALDRWDVRLMKCDAEILLGEEWVEFDSVQLNDITA